MNNYKDELKELYDKVKYIPKKGTEITYPKDFDFTIPLSSNECKDSKTIKSNSNKVKTLTISNK